MKRHILVAIALLLVASGAHAASIEGTASGASFEGTASGEIAVALVQNKAPADLEISPYLPTANPSNQAPVEIEFTLDIDAGSMVMDVVRDAYLIAGTAPATPSEVSEYEVRFQDDTVTGFNRDRYFDFMVIPDRPGSATVTYDAKEINAAAAGESVVTYTTKTNAHNARSSYSVDVSDTERLISVAESTMTVEGSFILICWEIAMDYTQGETTHEDWTGEQTEAYAPAAGEGVSSSEFKQAFYRVDSGTLEATIRDATNLRMFVDGTQANASEATLSDFSGQVVSRDGVRMVSNEEIHVEGELELALDSLFRTFDVLVTGDMTHLSTQAGALDVQPEPEGMNLLWLWYIAAGLPLVAFALFRMRQRHHYAAMRAASQSEDHEEAIRQSQYLLSSRRFKDNAYKLRAKALMQTDRNVEAEAYLQKVDKLNRTANWNLLMAQCQARLGNPSGARRYAEKATALDPTIHTTMDQELRILMDAYDQTHGGYA